MREVIGGAYPPQSEALRTPRGKQHMKRSFVRILGFVTSITIGATILARAEDAPYVGTWALEPTQCGAEQASAEAPLVIAKDRYDQHETHCTFKSVEEKAGDFKISADCTVEGSAQPQDILLTVSGDTLTFADAAGARDFLRCK
jgi:hypothetical protein